MDEFLYRVDRLKHLRNVRDKFFRARSWPNGVDYPHKALKAAQQSVPEGLGIFRVCFWQKFDSAKKSLEIDYRHWNDGVITRIPREDMTGLGFIETWDDGFSEGEAYLFWRYATGLPNDPSLSTSGISTDRIEAYKDGAWLPFELVVFTDREEASAPRGEDNVRAEQAGKLSPPENSTDNSLWRRLKRIISANG
ncbi:hypothetical protein ABQF04_09760 [Xanthomonas campestris pv. campestris]|uniref:hypothetical protein n=1 Tax=Xanthomonas campestris TaxID=339 RepID=UPI0032E508C9